MFIFLCYDPDYEIQKKTHLHVWKCKQQEFLVFPLRPAHVLTYDYVFLIMDIVLVTRMFMTMRVKSFPMSDGSSDSTPEAELTSGEECIEAFALRACDLLRDPFTSSFS